MLVALASAAVLTCIGLLVTLRVFVQNGALERRDSAAHELHHQLAVHVERAFLVLNAGLLDGRIDLADREVFLSEVSQLRTLSTDLEAELKDSATSALLVQLQVFLTSFERAGRGFSVPNVDSARAHAAAIEAVDADRSRLLNTLGMETEGLHQQLYGARQTRRVASLGLGLLSMLVAGTILSAVTFVRTRRRVSRADQERFDALVHNAKESIVVVDAAGVIVYASDSTRALFDDGEIHPESLTRDALHPDDDARIRREIATKLAGPGSSFTTTIRWKSPTRWKTLESTFTNLLDNPTVRGIAVAVRDISERTTLADNLKTIIDSSPLAIVEVDLDGCVSLWNSAATELFGWTSDEVVGKAVPYIPDSELDSFEEGRRDVLSGLRPVSVDVLRQHKDGHLLHLTVSTAARHDPTGAPVGTVAFFLDASERRAAIENLYRLAYHDSLTGLGNRAEFIRKLSAALERKQDVAVLFVDLDDFKTVNDSLGHEAGDELVRHVAARFSARLRSHDLAARFGGDEFAILLERSDIQTAERVARGILTTFELPFQLQGREVYVHGSIGVAMGTTGDSADDILRNADAAMYEAKSSGKGRLCSYRPQMHQAALRRLDLKASLRRAIDNGELEVHYQPIVEFATNTAAAAEALVRWRKGPNELVPPAEFIPIAEETGLISSLGRLVLDASCHQAAPLLGADGLDFVSVNLSATQLLQDSIVGEVKAAIESSGIDPAHLMLEITETVMMVDPDQSLRVLHELRDLGVGLAIDDFGTGYSSLWCIQNLPITMIKLDRAFTVALAVRPDDLTVAKSVIDLGRSLGLEIVAEGIEREVEAELLEGLGCRYGQGFLFARATPIGTFPATNVILLNDQPRRSPTIESRSGRRPAPGVPTPVRSAG